MDDQQREKLLRMRKELQEMLSEIDAKIEAIDGLEPVVVDLTATYCENTRVAEAKTSKDVEEAHVFAAKRPAREIVLDALEDTNWPTYSRVIALYCMARFGRSIPATRFGTLAADEMRAYLRSRQDGARARPVWLCFALTYDRYEPIKRLWARSDWPLEWRVVAPTTGRVQHLKITARLCDLALRAEETATDPEMLKIIAADHARDLPGVKVQRGKFELETWRDVALRLLAELEPRDEEARKESARQLSRRSEYHQLFGLPDVIEGTEPVQQVGRERL